MTRCRVIGAWADIIGSALPLLGDAAAPQTAPAGGDTSTTAAELASTAGWMALGAVVLSLVLWRVLRAIKPPPGVPNLGPAGLLWRNISGRGLAVPHTGDDDDFESADEAAARGRPVGPAVEWGVVEFGVGIVLYLFVGMMVMSRAASGGQLSPADSYGLHALIQLTVVAALLLGVGVIYGRNPLPQLFPRVTYRRTWLILPLTVLAVPAVLCFAGFVNWVLMALGIEFEAQPTVQMLRDSPPPDIWAAAAFAAIVAAPVAEEVAFRGFLYVGLRRLLGPTGAVLVSAGLFGVAHGFVAATIPLVGLGIVLAVVFERTRNLGVVIWIHALFNATTFVIIAATP
jgi:membrane protease YdiL (CAAX protease family)